MREDELATHIIARCFCIFAVLLSTFMSQKNLQSTYTQRRDAFQARKRNPCKQNICVDHSCVLFFSLSVFGVGIYLASLGWWYIGIYIPLFIASFGWLVKRHLQLQRAQHHQEQLSRVNVIELDRLEYQMSEGDSGERFLDPLHPYAIDLDIFGSHSFFQYINRSTTAIGKEQLADHLLSGVETPEIKRRQAAIKELSQMLDWRQAFQARGLAAQG